MFQYALIGYYFFKYFVYHLTSSENLVFVVLWNCNWLIYYVLIHIPVIVFSVH